MARESSGSALRTVNTYLTIIASLVIAGVGVVLLLLSGASWIVPHTALKTLVEQLGGLLVVTGGISLLWDLKGRRAFADEVLAKAQVGADVRSSGLQRVTMQWLEDVAWARLFGSAKDIEVFLSYGQSWRNLNWQRLKDFCDRSGHKLRVYLPDPRDRLTMDVLAQRYDSTHDKISERILESARAFAGLKKQRGGADVRVYYRRGDPTFACYRFDDEIVVTLYSHRRSRGDVPAVVVARGSLFDFFSADLAGIRKQSVEQNQTTIGGH